MFQVCKKSYDKFYLKKIGRLFFTIILWFIIFKWVSYLNLFRNIFSEHENIIWLNEIKMKVMKRMVISTRTLSTNLYENR